MPDFTDKIILITGAGSGIGRATAIKLASLGATLSISDINAASVEGTKNLCKVATSRHGHLTPPCDVTSSPQCYALIAETVIQYGRLDHVFNCAGRNPTAMPLTSVTDEYWDLIMNTNVKGTFNITRASMAHLSSGSTIVNVSSVLGLTPKLNYAPYCASKYAITGFTKCMALELGPQGIRVNAVAPGSIDTPTNIAIIEGPEAVERAVGSVPLGRIGQPEEGADLVAFLMSDERKYISGSVVEIHGGSH